MVTEVNALGECQGVACRFQRAMFLKKQGIPSWNYQFFAYHNLNIW